MLRFSNLQFSASSRPDWWLRPSSRLKAREREVLKQEIDSETRVGGARHIRIKTEPRVFSQLKNRGFRACVFCFAIFSSAREIKQRDLLACLRAEVGLGTVIDKPP